MNLLLLKIRIPKVSNNLIKEANEEINYTIFLEEERISNYNQSILIPEKTAVIEEFSTLIKNYELSSNEINLLVTQEELLKKYSELKLKTKKLTVNHLKTHELIDELLNNTIIHYEKDSINDSLKIIELSKKINEYSTVIPQDLLDEHLKVTKSLEKIKPASNKINMASLKNGLSFSGPNIKTAKDGLMIKHWSDKAKYEFSINGTPFYELGPLGKLCNELIKIWL